MNPQLLPQNQIAEIIGRLGCFAGLSPECLLRLANGARPLRIARGEMLFSKGEAADALYAVVSGQIKTYLPLINGTEKVIALVEPGGVIGLSALFLDRPQAVNALARTDGHLLAIQRDVLRSQAHQDAGLACRMLEAASQRVMNLLHDMESCAPRSSLQRVSCFLLQHRPHPRAQRYEFVLNTSKREIAAKLNLAHETLSRAFQQLSGEGAIAVRGRLIEVCDSDMLMTINLLGCAGQR